MQIFPAEGSPPSLVTGDRIQVVYSGLDDEGFFLYATGETTF